MSSLTTLARPYAKAAFEIASDQGDLAGWSAALAGAAAAVGDPTMQDWLRSPEQDRALSVEVINRACGGELSESLMRFLGVLSDNDRLVLLPEISGLYETLREQAENRLSVRVVSAIPLDEGQAHRMTEALARRFDCDIELSNEVDPGVLGGAVIYAGDEVIDGSVTGRLARLQNSLA